MSGAIRCCVVPFAMAGPTDEVQLSPAERAHVWRGDRRDIDRLAGRIAAKAAVAAVLGVQADAIEIRPGRHASGGAPCGRSHRPEVIVEGEPAGVAMSLAHGAGVAVAIALAQQLTAGLEPEAVKEGG